MKALKLTNKELELNADKNADSDVDGTAGPTASCSALIPFPIGTYYAQACMRAWIITAFCLTVKKVALYDNISNRFLYEMRLSTMISGTHITLRINYPSMKGNSPTSSFIFPTGSSSSSSQYPGGSFPAPSYCYSWCPVYQYRVPVPAKITQCRTERFYPERHP